MSTIPGLLHYLYSSLQNWEIVGEVTQFLWAGPSSFANQCMLFVGLLICYKKPHTDPKPLLATESLQNPHTWDTHALTRGCSFKHHLTREILTSLMALTEWSLGSYFGIGRNLRLCYRQTHQENMIRMITWTCIYVLCKKNCLNKILLRKLSLYHIKFSYNVTPLVYRGSGNSYKLEIPQQSGLQYHCRLHVCLIFSHHV